jgi:post-segregation antitoxin (ccd killing protein)
MTTPRNRGPRWSSPKQADRGRPGRMVYLSKELHDRLNELKDAKVNISAIAEEALRAHHKVNLPPEHET